MNSVASVLPDREEVPPIRPAESVEVLRWQERLLPLMTRFIAVMAVAFFCFSGAHLYLVSRFIETDHGKDIRSLIESEVAKPAGQPLSTEEVLQDSLLLLEADTLDKRYHQASALLLSRIWSRQLAFITGMVMAFLGAVFILGKLSESTSQITGGNAQWRVGISSASPGIVLSALGTVLLITSLLVQSPLDVSDGPAYVMALRRAAVGTSATTGVVAAPETAKPLDLGELQKLQEKREPAPPAAH